MTTTVKFLLVDDMQKNLLAFEALLQQPGLEIVKARSGSEALALTLAHDFALALVDVQMPEMDGFELAALMRGTRRTNHIPIIFVTAGLRDPQRVFQGYDTGAVDFLFKPIDPFILRHKTRTFFELYKQKQQLNSQLDQLRQAEEFRRRMMELSPDCICVLDLHGYVVSGNKIWARGAWLDLWHRDDRGVLAQAFTEAATGRTVHAEARHETSMSRITVAPLHDAKGNVTQILAVARDPVATRTGKGD